MNINSPTPTKNSMRSWASKVALGIVTVFSVAAIGLTGTTQAQGGNTSGGDPTNGAPTSKEDCKRGGWKAYGFQNQGSCVSWVNDHGYGGGNGGGNGQQPEPKPWWHFDISGDNNVVNIVINYIFG